MSRRFRDGPPVPGGPVPFDPLPAAGTVRGYPPRRRGGRMTRFGLALSACLILSPAAFACSVPVFRYALERWQPSKYELIVYHRGPLQTTEGGAVRRLAAAARGANVRLTEADLVGLAGASLQQAWDREGQGA